MKKISFKNRLKRLGGGILDRAFDFGEYIILSSVKPVLLMMCFFLIIRFMGFINTSYETKLIKDKNMVYGALEKCQDRKINGSREF